MICEANAKVRLHLHACYYVKLKIPSAFSRWQSLSSSGVCICVWFKSGLSFGRLPVGPWIHMPCGPALPESQRLACHLQQDLEHVQQLWCFWSQSHKMNMCFTNLRPRLYQTTTRAVKDKLKLTFTFSKVSFYPKLLTNEAEKNQSKWSELEWLQKMCLQKQQLDRAAIGINTDMLRYVEYISHILVCSTFQEILNSTSFNPTCAYGVPNHCSHGGF